MKVSELIKLLQEVDNQDATIDFVGNNTDARDPSYDAEYNTAEVWHDGENSITLFIYVKK
jgi:hypothetical protein